MVLLTVFFIYFKYKKYLIIPFLLSKYLIYIGSIVKLIEFLLFQYIS